MPKKVKEKDLLESIDFSAVHIRNEARELKELKKMYPDLPEAVRNPKAIQDVYALALNSLPARYTQPGSIVLREPVRTEHIQAAIREAAGTASVHPKE